MVGVHQPPTSLARRRGRVFPAVILSGLICALISTHTTWGEEATTVVVSRPRPAPDQEAKLPGSFEPYERVLLYAKVTGYVSQIDADIGDRLSRDAVLVKLDLPEMQPKLGRAEADIVAAEAALTKAQAQAEREGITYQRLLNLQTSEPLAVTQQDVDMASANLHISEAGVQSAKAEITIARAMLEELQALMTYAVVRAPFDGVVVRRFVDHGSLVVSGSDGGKPVLEMVREDRLRLVLAIPEPIVPLTRVGVMAEISVDTLPGRTFKGTIARCAVSLTPDTRTMRAEIDTTDQGGLLRSGMYATVRLKLSHDDGQLSVPASLIRHQNDGRAFLWTVRGGVAERSFVEIARDDGASAVIQTGLRPESLVVLEVPPGLREGQAVLTKAAVEESR